MDQNYVADLTQSMQEKGFLPEYPIEVVPAANLPNIETQLPYICACGAHRTHAAIKAKLEKVLVHIYDEREEAFIERMHLDNFQFDPAINSSIGQPFTNKEKRAACTQLLLLPKYFEMTNAALHEAWRIPETSIRRWREEVVQLIETNSPKIRYWAISDERIARLQELAASTERVDGDGKVVTIRKKVVDASESEKEAFIDLMEDDAADWEETTWDEIRTHVVSKFNVASKWDIERDVTMKQLQSLHQLILAQDKTFLEAVKNTVAKEAEAQEDANWRKQRTALLTAIEEYPRPIEASVLLYHCDDHLRRNMGTMRKLIDSEAPSAKKFTATIEAEADWFKRSAYAISKDVKFIAEIPEPKQLAENQGFRPAMVDNAEVNSDIVNSMFFVKVSWTENRAIRSQIFEDGVIGNSSVEISEMPERIRQELIEIALKFHKR